MNKKTFVYWILYSLSFIYTETLFVVLSEFSFFSISRVRMLLFVLSFSLLLAIITSLLPKKIAGLFLFFTLFLYSFYVLFQSSFYDYMGYYLSVNTAKTTAGNVSEFVLDFIRAIQPLYLLYFVPLIVLFLSIKTKFLILPTWKVSIKQTFTSILLLVLVHFLSLGSLYILHNPTQMYTPVELYKNPAQSFLAIQELGVNRYGVRDFWTLFNGNDNNPVIVDPTIPNDDTPIDQPEPEDDFDRVVLTDKWKELRDNETNSRIKQIDDYLLAKDIVPKNDKTGLFKDKNLVFIMVEALDYMAIHPELTPTLYSITTEGWHFNNHHAVRASCTTGESEFMGLLSIIPSVSVCSPYEYADNEYTLSAFNLFKDNGYSVSSYHSYFDQFYPRSEWHENMGSEFYHSDHMDIQVLQGWPSDYNLFEESYKKIRTYSEPFMSFITTAAMHFPYDADSVLGNRYLQEVNQVYPDAPIEVKRYLSKAIDFDKGLARLFELLKEDGKFDDTVFVLYGDHHPFRMNGNYINQYTADIDRFDGFNMDLNPLLIYNSEIEAKTYSMLSWQIDLLPTIANLFDLDYDPRLYMGKDLFDSNDNIIIFTNSSWKTNKGNFYATTQQFIPNNENNTYTTEEIVAINQFVRNQFLISEEILDTDYYAYRKKIIP